MVHLGNRNIYCTKQDNTKLYKLKKYKPIYKYKYFSGNINIEPLDHEWFTLIQFIEIEQTIDVVATIIRSTESS